ncbi:hypothetical protein GCM10009753_02260 [Streptantibioticus ferralitis]
MYVSRRRAGAPLSTEGIVKMCRHDVGAEGKARHTKDQVQGKTKETVGRVAATLLRRPPARLPRARR